MKVKDIKLLLAKVPGNLTEEEFDEMEVLMPMSGEFDGYFLSPCEAESGVVGMAVDEDSDETRDSFVIVPHGFYDERHGVPPELN